MPIPNTLHAALSDALELLNEARGYVLAVTEEVGYGFWRPENPHDFTPDMENSAEEIAAHKAACEAFDRGEYKREDSDGWISPDVHVLHAPWGPGAYVIRNEDACALLAKIDAAIAALPHGPEIARRLGGEDFVLVPREATDRMIGAGSDAANAFRVDAMRMWDAMIAAAPSEAAP